MRLERREAGVSFAISMPIEQYPIETLKPGSIRLFSFSSPNEPDARAYLDNLRTRIKEKTGYGSSRSLVKGGDEYTLLILRNKENA